jgi:sucrose phosphorylase
LDRGFSIIDYDLNQDLASRQDLDEVNGLGIQFKFDLVLNHLSVASPQFQDLLQHGDRSEYIDFFIDWNTFWQGHGEKSTEGFIVPSKDHLEKLFMRKPGLPILKVRFPDGSNRFYWNTFYQKVSYSEISTDELSGIDGLTKEQAEKIAAIVNQSLGDNLEANQIEFGAFAPYRHDILPIIERKAHYLGQMDLNAGSEQVWAFYEETFQKLHGYGAKLIRLDAFAYLHKQPGMANFFNKPGTWEYLEHLRRMAVKYDLVLLPEIHSTYGSGIHNELAEKGYLIYDFFLPGLIIDALDRGTSKHLLHWIREISNNGIRTVNMLGCHDGIPVLDLKGKLQNGELTASLLPDEEIETVIENIISRGGIVKNLFGSDGKRIAYYQVNATFFSALGEDDQKMRLARAIQLFTPGTPQVWYLDLFAGKNNCHAIGNGDACAHKEINRTNLSLEEVEAGLERAVVQDQLRMLRLRNTSSAFNGHLEVGATHDDCHLDLTWQNGRMIARLQADLENHGFHIMYTDPEGQEQVMRYD